MSTSQIMIHCKRCGKPTIHLAQHPNHIMHLLLTVFTAGLWLIVWVFAAAGTQKPQCTVCGKRNSQLKSFALSD